MDKTIGDFITYISSEKGLSLHTIEAYRRDILSLFAYLNSLHLHSFQKVTQIDLIDYLSSLKQRNYASSSICRALMAVKTFFRFLKREGYIPINIALYLDTPSIWQLIPEVLTTEEVESLLVQPDTSEETGARNRAILEVLYGSGLRVSELCRLELYDVGDDSVRIFGKGNKERIIPLGKKAIEAIDYYLTHFRGQYDSRQNKLLFVNDKGLPINRVSVWRMIKECGKQAGITKNISPHTLRHSFATHLLDNGADLRVIQEMMGHASINSTERYTHLSHRHLQEAFQKCHPKFT